MKREIKVADATEGAALCAVTCAIDRRVLTNNVDKIYTNSYIHTYMSIFTLLVTENYKKSYGYYGIKFTLGVFINVNICVSYVLI